MIKIANRHFSDVSPMPCPKKYEFKYKVDYDKYIAGWTKYWNDVLKPDQLLSPNLVKALIASESSFNPKLVVKAGKREGYARGIMQLTDLSLASLRNRKGEIKDHYIVLAKKDMMDANLNICASIRWLFQKKRLTESKLGHSASWENVIEFYKGAYGKSADVKKRTVGKFLGYLERFEKCE